MTTSTITSVLDQSTDAGFRAWITEHIAQCLAVGLTQTTDTGQVNTVTVTRPAINSDAGYAIFRFNDTVQSTAPVFIKFYYGAGGTIASPRIKAQVGTASNGTGTVSGLGSANTDIITNVNAAPLITTTFASYYCYTGGHFWFSWKINASIFGVGYPWTFFSLERSTDSTGAYISDATSQIYFPGSGTPVVRSNSYLTSIIYTASANTFSLIIYGVTTSDVAGTKQIYKTYYITPRVRPSLGMLSCLTADIPLNTSLTATTVGATPHNYIVANVGISAVTAFTMIYE